MAGDAMDVCLLVLKESNKSRFDIQLQFQEQCIDHIPYYLSGLSRAHFFRQQFLEIAVYKKKNLDKLVRSFCASFGDQEMLGDESRWQKYFTHRNWSLICLQRNP